MWQGYTVNPHAKELIVVTACFCGSGLAQAVSTAKAIIGSVNNAQSGSA